MRNESPFQVIKATHPSKGEHRGPWNFALATWRADPSYHFAAPSVPSLSGGDRELPNDWIT
jgi:hypothetical protein